ncbi:uncharacterized protein Dana_GF27455 [Drosophila ananassae]|uniref:Uncharacterized protein n=1 Tax=Drosophila ananassae TaxID=7217 RepID=A0A0P9C5Q2_DROAN|nr:uncharacterized protein Dana_GF27455 [Drosophila ananassae]
MSSIFKINEENDNDAMEGHLSKLQKLMDRCEKNENQIKKVLEGPHLAEMLLARETERMRLSLEKLINNKAAK